MGEESADYFDLDLSELRLVEGTHGYWYFHMPAHPLAHGNGMVPVHRHVMSVHVGRWLEPKEAVVHVNKDVKDFRIENLKIYAQGEIYKETLGEREPVRVEMKCERCGKPFFVVESHVKRRRHCSPECDRESRKKFDISPEKLAKLVWEVPTSQIAADFGVSDKAVEKRCKKYGIPKPPRGYWARLYAGQITPEIEEALRAKWPPQPK